MGVVGAGLISSVRLEVTARAGVAAARSPLLFKSSPLAACMQRRAQVPCHAGCPCSARWGPPPQAPASDLRLSLSSQHEPPQMPALPAAPVAHGAAGRVPRLCAPADTVSMSLLCVPLPGF